MILLYRPQQTRSEDLEAILVARNPLVEEILERLRRWRPAASRRHCLLIGPRGIGKSFLLQIVRHRIRRSRLSETVAPIILPEEGYGIGNVADVLIESLHVLGKETEDGDVRRTYAEVCRDPDDERVVDLALDGFRRYRDRTGKCVLLMLENAGRILDTQIRDRTRSQTRLLHKILTEEDWLIVIGTSPTYGAAVTSGEEPLFPLFDVKQVAELTLDEQELLLRKLATFERNADFEEYLREFHSRPRAMYHFTGGNPRLAIMLYDLVAHKKITDVQAQLDSLLDQQTPFYRDRMKELAVQEARLLEQMALRPEGCTPTELAREARMPANLVRSLLVRLERSGYVRHEERRKKQTVYIIPERFFRIWHQMNHSRAARGRVRYLLEFFSHWCGSREERDRVWDELVQEFQREASIGSDNRAEDVAAYMQYIAAVPGGKEAYEREFGRLRLVASSQHTFEIESQLSILDRDYGKYRDYYLEKGRFLGEVLGQHSRALSAFDEALVVDPGNAAALYNRAVALDKLERLDEATAAYEQAAAALVEERSTAYSKDTEKLLLRTLREAESQRLAGTAADLLGRIADRSIVGTIVSIAKESEAPWRRRLCATTLGKLGGEQAVDGLFLLFCDPDGEVRSASESAMQRVAPKLAVGPLCRRLRSEDPFERAAAATALGKSWSNDAVGPLLSCLKDSDAAVRKTAATGLGRIVSADAVARVVECLKDTDAVVRGSAATALGRIGSEEAVGPLLECLNDAVPANRSAAAAALGQIGSKEAVNSLIACLEDRASQVRGSAATALGRIGSEEAIAALFECLKDAVPANRGCAATALGRIGSPDAVACLIACLEDDAGNVRGSAAIALGRIAATRRLPQLVELVEALLREVPVTCSRRLEIVQHLLRSAFRSSDRELIAGCIATVSKYAPDGDEICAPHIAALKYIDSDRDPAVIERQHREMREAVTLLVGLYDRGEGARENLRCLR